MRDDDLLRSFSMSAMMIEADMREIEATHGVRIKTTSPVSKTQDVLFYNQFEAELRLEAESMSKHYAVFYCLEKSIRRLISDVLETSAGPEWWTKTVPEDVQVEVSKSMQREKEAGVTPRSDDPIDYSTFGQLADIIAQNWDAFGGTLQSKKGVQRVLWQLNMLRGPIAHCSALAPDEIDRLGLAMKDWFRQLTPIQQEE